VLRAGLLSGVSFSTKLHEGHEENASVAAALLVGTILRHVLSSCGVETPQDKDVKDDFSTHVLKDVAICSNTFWILRFAQHDDANDVLFFKEMPLKQKHEKHPPCKSERGARAPLVAFRLQFPYLFVCLIREVEQKNTHA
jgi:hypothetical protein